MAKQMTGASIPIISAVTACMKNSSCKTNIFNEFWDEVDVEAEIHAGFAEAEANASMVGVFLLLSGAGISI